MNNNDRKMFNYIQLIQQLRNFCVEKRSGTMLIISSDSHSIRFVLNNGIIIACAYTMTQGSDALTLIKTIQGGSFSFVDGGFTGGMNINESPLPDTAIIFKILESNNAATSPQTSTTTVSTNNLNITPILESIEKELSQIIGPMAEYICEEYIEDMGSPTNLADIDALVNYLALEIDDTNDKEQFRQAVASKIR